MPGLPNIRSSLTECREVTAMTPSQIEFLECFPGRVVTEWSATCRCPVCGEALTLTIFLGPGGPAMGCSRRCSLDAILSEVGWSRTRFHALGALT